MQGQGILSSSTMRGPCGVLPYRYRYLIAFCMACQVLQRHYDGCQYKTFSFFFR